MNNLSILPNNIADEPPAPPIKVLDVLLRPPAQPPAVRVVDIEMGFGSMVVFMVKWAFAAIPAMLAIFGIILLILVVMSGAGFGLGSLLK